MPWNNTTMITVRQVELIKCKVSDCDEHFSAESDAVQHLKLHSKLHQCPECEVQCTTKEGVIDHYEDTHFKD